MKKWVVETTQEMCKNSNTNKQVLSAMTLLNIMNSLSNKKFLHLDDFEDEIGSLLKRLFTKVDLDTQSIPSYQILLTGIKQNSRYVHKILY